jgi:hypothetical protein
MFEETLSKECARFFESQAKKLKKPVYTPNTKVFVNIKTPLSHAI